MKWYWWLGIGVLVVGGAYVLFFRDDTKKVADQRADTLGIANPFAGFGAGILTLGRRISTSGGA